MMKHVSKKLTPIFTFPMLYTFSNVAHANEIEHKVLERDKVLKSEKLRVSERLKIANTDDEKTSLLVQKLNCESELNQTILKLDEPQAQSKEIVQKEVTIEKPKEQSKTQYGHYEVVANQSTNAGNAYGYGWCTWGVKQVAPWVGNYWGNAYQWAASASAEGFQVGTTPIPGSVIVWSGNHVAYVTDVREDGMIQVLESNFNGNRAVANYRGWFNPNGIQGAVSYIYPKN